MTRRLAVVFSAVAVLAVAGVLVVTRSGDSDPTAPPPVTSADDGQVASSQRANACLGGAANINDAVLYAHQHAPITPAGAAEFAATVVRWMAPNRNRTGDEIDIAGRVATPGAAQEWADHLINGTKDWTVTDYDFTDGGWYVVQPGAQGVPSSVIVVALMRGSAGQSTNTDMALRLKLVVGTDGHWRADGFAPVAEVAPDLAGLKPSGTVFQGEC